MLAGSKQKAQLFWLRFYVGWIGEKCVVAGAKEKEEQEGPVTDWRASNADLSWLTGAQNQKLGITVDHPPSVP